MNSRLLTLVLVFLSLVSSAARGQNHTDRGAALGGIAGALTGAAIGKQNDETAAGALIGGALGLVTGAAIGGARDADIARAHARQQHLQWQMARAVSPQDVVSMTHGGLSDPLIINHIHQNGTQRPLEVADVISLHQQGVSEAVIAAMQRAPAGPAYAAPIPVATPPIVVRQHHYVPPPYFYGPRYPHFRYHHQHHHHAHPRARWGVRVGF